MELFSNLIYEYKKGMRDLSLYSCNGNDLLKLQEHLKQTKTEYITHKIDQDKYNIFFGNPLCLQILKSFSTLELDKLNPSEDFILGIMLGYSRNEQYQRILSKI